MIKGRKVYDPLTNTYSTGYWVADDKGNYYPVWQKGEKQMNENYYKNMPEDFKKAVAVIKNYCQHEDCAADCECDECPYPLSMIRCGDEER